MQVIKYFIEVVSFMKKKILLCLIVTIFLLSNIAFAAMPVIKADKQYFDINNYVHVLSGNVQIEHKNRRVTAGEAKTNMLEVWGTGGITFTQGDIAISGSNIYVSFPKNLVQIDGNINFTRSGLKISSDKVDFNWSNKLAVFCGNVQIDQNGTLTTADTLSYNVETNTIL